MPYLATIALDYTGANKNAYAKLITALLQSGWEYAETSTVYIEAEDLDGIRLGLAVLAHGLNSPGDLSNLSLTVQFVGPGGAPSYVRNHPYALDQILAYDLPLA